jgi:uncharacterized membrane protein
MSNQTAGSVTSKGPIQSKHFALAIFVLMTLFVVVTRERTLLDPNSFLRQRYAPIPWLMFAHGIPGALALILGIFQFSTRLRQRYTQLHRVMGYIYIVCTIIAAPVALAVSLALPLPSLFMASVIQAAGWIFCTGTALYCIRLGTIQQHREWMLRGYAFAAVFVVARVILAIPSIAAMGVFGIVTVVWSTIAMAGLLPSFVIALQAVAANRRAVKARSMAGAD